jgi:hypothetical protein
MGLFGGKPKQLKNLDQQLLAASTAFGTFQNLPPQNQAIFLELRPADRRGRGAGRCPRRTRDGGARNASRAATPVPAGATDEQWQRVVDAGVAALGS